MKQIQKTASNRVKTLPISLFILVVLGFQLNGTFNLVCRRQTLAYFPQFKHYCAPALWPFVDYTMYIVTAYENDQLEKPYIFGTLADGREVAIRPNDLGLKPPLFFRLFLGVSEGNPKRLRELVERYHARHAHTLTQLRLETEIYQLTPDGAVPISKRVVSRLDTQSIR